MSVMMYIHYGAHMSVMVHMYYGAHIVSLSTCRMGEKPGSAQGLSRAGESTFSWESGPRL